MAKIFVPPTTYKIIGIYFKRYDIYSATHTNETLAKNEFKSIQKNGFDKCLFIKEEFNLEQFLPESKDKFPSISTKFLRTMEKEAARMEKFEKAAEIRDTINYRKQ